jgi:hypothetical protein
VAIIYGFQSDFLSLSTLNRFPLMRDTMFQNEYEFGRDQLVANPTLLIGERVRDPICLGQ